MMYNNYNPNYLQYPVQLVYPQQQQQPRPHKKYDVFGNPYFTYDEPTQQMQYLQNQSAPSKQNIAPQNPQQPTKASPPFMLVENEQQAQDYEIEINNVGVVHLFALKDDSKLFAKRINPSNFEKEFATYVKVLENNPHKNNVSLAATVDNEIVNSIDSRLKKIEQFVDNASLLLLNAGNIQSDPANISSAINTETEQQRTRRTIKKDGSANIANIEGD